MHAVWSIIRHNDGQYIKLVKMVWAGLSLACFLVIPDSSGSYLFLRYFSGVVRQPKDLQVSQHVVPVESSFLTHHRSYP